MVQVTLCDDCKQALAKHVESKNGFDEHGRAIIHGGCINDMIGECSCRPPHKDWEDEEPQEEIAVLSNMASLTRGAFVSVGCGLAVCICRKC